MEKLAYVYMMSSASRRALYTGVTVPIYQRVWENKNNLGGDFTKRYKCYRLVYYESFASVIAAIGREKEIKGWRREKKNRLVESINPEWQDLAADWYPEEFRKDGIAVKFDKENARSLTPTHALKKARVR
jgi:putative endonuclease